MSLTTKLNLMKLKSNSTQIPSSNHHHSSNASSPMSTSTSVPIFTFKNDSKLDDASVSMIGSQFSEKDPNVTESSKASSSLSSSPSQTAPISILNNSNNSSDNKIKATSSSSSSSVLESKRLKKNLGTYDSNEEDSPESSGDEYVHSGFVDEENKLIET